MENRYYLYRHIRTDLNIPFYIGIGKKRTRTKNPSFETESKIKIGLASKRRNHKNKDIQWT